MASSLSKKIQATVLSAAILLPAGAAFGNDWSKRDSRTKGTVVGAVAGALVGGTRGAVVGAALGNGIQAVRGHNNYHRRYRHVSYRNGRRYVWYTYGRR
jgi:uncharacterized protein YcfJ